MTAKATYVSQRLFAAALGGAILMAPTAGQAQASNPWAAGSGAMQRPSSAPRPAPAAPLQTPVAEPKPKYYQEPPQAAPTPLTGSGAPSRFAPENLDQRLSTGLPLAMTIPSPGYPGAPLAAPRATGPVPTYGQLPGAVAGRLPAPGYGQGYTPYGLGNGYGGTLPLPGYGTANPLGTLGYPGTYGGLWPPPGGLTSGTVPGFDFSPFGFW